MSPVGKRFGAWTVIDRCGHDSHGTPMVSVRCDCGRTFRRTEYAIVNGKSASCRSCASTNHGHNRDGSRSPEYSTWMRMISRCYYANDTSFHEYGARGITVCDEWRGDGGFERFLAHIGPRPSRGHSIDRIDNDRGYEPGNVRWATPREQTNNRRNTIRLTVDGVEKPLTDWARELGLKPYVIRHRLKIGMSAERALGVNGRTE